MDNNMLHRIRIRYEIQFHIEGILYIRLDDKVTTVHILHPGG
jgi:hypothetical protein